jgi:predicted extracellular nuclease
MVNHFKCKGFGAAADSNARRPRQAERVAELYEQRRSSDEYVVVLGDLNDTPDSAPLKALVQDTDLRDVSTHPRFRDDGRPGTYANDTKSNKIDYILLSPALYAKLTFAESPPQGADRP